MASKKEQLAFQKQNYFLMLLSIAVIILGYIVMASDNETFGFGFLGLTLGPLILIAGFIIGFVAILYKPKQEEEGKQS